MRPDDIPALRAVAQANEEIMEQKFHRGEHRFCVSSASMRPTLIGVGNSEAVDAMTPTARYPSHRHASLEHSTLVTRFGLSRDD
jgi:hypothetical protein